MAVPGRLRPAAESCRYATAVALAALAIGLRTALGPTLGTQALYLFLVPAVLVAGIVGGLGQGVLATGLCVVLHLFSSGEYVNLMPGSPLFVEEASRAMTFVALGVGIAWFGERLEKARQESAMREAHLESILDTLPEAMIVIDERGIIQSFSSAAERLFGYVGDEVI